MINRCVALAATVALLGMAIPSSAALFGRPEGRAAGSTEQVGAQQQQQMQQQQAQHQQQQAVPPPAEQANRTPSKGARKLAQELSWDGIPRDLFQRYVGRWKGEFYAYSPLGKKEQVNKVTVEYVIQSDGSMKMSTLSYDMISKRWVVQETAVYSVQGDTVRVDITRATGQTSRQLGHYSDGQLFLQGQISDGVEHFRERIDGQGRLLVDGFGCYGGSKSKDNHIFIGRFTRE